MKTLARAVAVSCLLAGCVSPIPAKYSSGSYLRPSDTGATLDHSASESAIELTRLLETRGYAMVDTLVNAPNGQLLVKFSKGSRALVATKDPDVQSLNASDVGSVVYAWITPTGASSSSVQLLAKPTLGGMEPCTTDTPSGLKCQEVDVYETFLSTHMSAQNEAEVVHGVLSELALEGYVAGSPTSVTLATPPPPPHADPACLAQRSGILKEASKLSDADARARLIETAPTCD